MRSRRSKDKEVNGEGKKLCKYLEERGWGVMNGSVEGDEEGEWTFTGRRGISVIDYVLGNEDTREMVERLEESRLRSPPGGDLGERRWEGRGSDGGKRSGA